MKQHEEDADTLIVSTALDISKDYESVIIVGEDIDLLVILIGTANAIQNNVFFLKSGRGKTPTSLYSTTSLKNQNLAYFVPSRIRRL